jgi:hypothetical protein
VHHSKLGRSMSALGQKRTFSEIWAMSALPPKADMVQCDPTMGFMSAVVLRIARTTKATNFGGLLLSTTRLIRCNSIRDAAQAQH